ncbi:MAG: CvpA family protein [Phycisphaerae bacterium]
MKTVRTAGFLEGWTLRTTAFVTPSSERSDSLAILDVAPRRRSATPGWVWTVRAVLFTLLFAAAVFGGPVVRVAAIAAGVFALWGDRDGCARHALRIAGFGLAVGLAPRAAGPATNLLAHFFGLTPAHAQLGGVVGTGAAILLAIAILSSVVNRLIRLNATMVAANRVTGALFGVGEGALLVATVCWFAHTFEQPLAAMASRIDAESFPVQKALVSTLDRVRCETARDPLGPWLLSLNPLARIRAVDDARNVATVAADPQAAQLLADDPRMAAFFELPVVRRHVEAFRHDDSIREAAKRKDMMAIMASPQFTALLTDAELRAALCDRWPELSAAFAAANAERGPAGRSPDGQ